LNYETKKKILEMLLIAGADINDRGNSFVRQPIILSIQYRDLDMCRLLVTLGADPKCSYIYRWDSPLYKAIDAGPDFVSYLLEQGAELPNNKIKAVHFYDAVIMAIPGVLEVFLDWYKRMDRQLPWKQLLITMAFGYSREGHVVAILQREYHLSVENKSRFIKVFFKRAIGQQFTQVMRLLIEQEPRIVHEAWMLERPVKLFLGWITNKDFLSWFERLQSQPFSLQLICRTQILRQLGPNSEPLINQLELPQALKEYLKTKNAL
jgi:hypothetical protein